MSRGRTSSAGDVTTDWGLAPSHAPGSGQRATITRAAPGLGFRNVCTGFTVMLCAGGTAPTAGTVTFAVIDGSSGGTNFLYGPVQISIANLAGVANGIVKDRQWLVGSENTPLTLEFATASATNAFQSVACEGCVIPR